MTDTSASEILKDEQSSPERPDYLPEKFWNDQTGETRIEALAQSYSELEKRFTSENLASQVPETVEDYRIEAPSDLLESAPEINTRLHDAGFTQEQAQLVYNLADEFLVPLVTELATDFEALHQVDRLTQHFGGAEKWQETARQIASCDPGAVRCAKRAVIRGLDMPLSAGLDMEKAIAVRLAAGRI